jgi:hypothetical protein
MFGCILSMSSGLGSHRGRELRRSRRKTFGRVFVETNIISWRVESLGIRSGVRPSLRIVRQIVIQAARMVCHSKS